MIPVVPVSHALHYVFTMDKGSAAFVSAMFDIEHALLSSSKGPCPWL